jgi:hypothetical protein
MRMDHDQFESRYVFPPAAAATWLLLRQFVILIWLEKRFKPHWPLWPFYVVFGISFVVQDVIYNFFVGTFLFLELPRFRGGVRDWEWMFTTRLKRMDLEGDLEGCTIRFKRVLNSIDPGHV